LIKKYQELGSKNCMQVCLASLFECDIDEVPKGACGDSWNFTEVQEWLRDKYGLQAVEIHIEGKDLYFYETLVDIECIIIGQSPRTNVLHAIVAKIKDAGRQKFEYIHDPHPDGTFISGEPVHVTFFIPVNLARPTVGYDLPIVHTPQ